MAVYNVAPFIEEAVQSILMQTFTDWELLIVDDGSDDGTVAKLRNFNDARIFIFEGGRRKGLPSRLNELIDRAHGTFFARMDGDDVAYPDRLARQVAYLKAHPDTDVVATGMVVFESDGTAVGRDKIRGSRHQDVVRTPWSGFHFNHATWMGNTGWFRRFRYRADVVRAEDEDLMLRSFSQSHFARLPDVLYGYRVDGLHLRKILRARLSFAQSLVRESIAQRSPRLAMGILGQVCKGLVDVVALVSGLNYYLLRHRAVPIDSAISARWDDVMAELLSQPSLSR